MSTNHERKRTFKRHASLFWLNYRKKNALVALVPHLIAVFFSAVAIGCNNDKSTKITLNYINARLLFKRENESETMTFCWVIEEN